METVLNQVRRMAFTTHCDKRGCLIPFECNTNLPFELKRAFIIYGVPPGESRGNHAHREGEQVLVSVRGTAKVWSQHQLYYLDNPTQGLYVPPGVSITIYPAPNCILMVLASNYYDPNDNL